MKQKGMPASHIPKKGAAYFKGVNRPTFCIGLLVRLFSFVFFRMFEFTSVSFGIDLDLVAEGMAKLP